MPGFVQFNEEKGFVEVHDGHDASVIRISIVEDDLDWELNAVNQLLAHERLKGRDHLGTGEVGDKMFQGAALLRGHGKSLLTGEEENFCYVDVNMHAHDENSKARHCAEGSAVNEIMKRYDERTIQISECDFMGGMSTLEEKGRDTLYSVQESGGYVPPCGPCLETLGRFSTQDTIFRLYPLSEGENMVHQDPLRTVGIHGYQELGPNEVWQTELQHLTGMRQYVPPDQNEARGDVSAALSYLHNTGTGPELDLLRTGGWGKLDDMAWETVGQDGRRKSEPVAGAAGYSNDILRQMNRVMMQSAAELIACQDHDIDRVSMAIIRTVDAAGRSRFRLGTHVEGKIDGLDIQSNFNPIESVISQISVAPKEAVTDVFYMNIEPKEMERMARGEAPVAFKLPGTGEMSYVAKAASRNRDKLAGIESVTGKYFYRHCTETFGPEVRVHLMTPVPPGVGKDDYDPDTHVISYGQRDVLPFAFTNKYMGAPKPAERY